MAVDVALADLLRATGYLVSSHVMARATLSRGTGRNEEPLTADIADVLTLLDPYSDFLRSRHSRSWLRCGVVDFSKAAESRIGADFVLIVSGSSGRPRRAIRKLVLVQAKREDWGNGRYASSTNHIDKAKSMAAKAGLPNSFFAYYHSDSVAPLVAAPWPTPPRFVYASPAVHGNRHFFEQGALHHAVPEGFLETSLYRRHLLGASSGYDLPPGYEWGIALLGADYFIDASGNTLKRKLPPIAHVLNTGAPLGSLLVDLAECRNGTPRTTAELRNLLAQFQSSADDESPNAFNPAFAFLVEFASGGQADDDFVPEPESEAWALENRRQPWRG